MKLVIGGVAQGKLDYVLENMIEKTENMMCMTAFSKDNACNDKASSWNSRGILPSELYS